MVHKIFRKIVKKAIIRVVLKNVIFQLVIKKHFLYRQFIDICNSKHLFVYQSILLSLLHLPPVALVKIYIVCRYDVFLF